eukprot:scaffold9505_cov202-Alexandrium_tamarense.AAC.12
MGNHPKLLASLAHSVLTDYSADVRAYSARALEWLSSDIHHPMKCHPRLLKALTTASQWTKTTCIAEALKMQASVAENRRSIVEHPGLLDALASLAVLDGINDDEVNSCAISAIERLSKEGATRHIMVRNEGVMTALMKATFADGLEDDDDEEGPHTTLLMKTALKNLAEHIEKLDTSRGHSTLMVPLAEFGSSNANIVYNMACVMKRKRGINATSKYPYGTE